MSDTPVSRNASSAQAAQPSYELHSLGWKAFQQLCVSVAGQIWGQTVQGFFDSRDGGRDGAFHGTWMPSKSESYSGPFVVQCKFSSQPAKVLQLSDLKEEVTKAKRLAAKGLAKNYFLFSNAVLTGASEERIGTAFRAIPGISGFAAYGSERISQWIRESPRLRMLVPRVYGLGDLSQILDERAYAQAREILSALGDDLAKFVITGAYEKATKALVDHGFVLLLGEPACGKSTIAAALALGALDQWGCFTVKVRDADDFVRHSNPHELKQFFWVDDAFGPTQIDWQSTVRWNQTFPHVHAAIRRGARVVFTSRDYVYRSARSLLKESALPVIQESQVVILVEQLTKDEREQILYNHIRLGAQPTTFKSRIKPHLPRVAAHTRFSPEIARRLGNPTFTKRLDLSAEGLEQFVARPMELLGEILRTLDAGSRSAIALVFMRGGALSSPVSLTGSEANAIGLLGGTQAEIRNSLVALDGSLLIQVSEGGQHTWRFKHPTIRDAFAALIAENRELMDIYLMGTPVRQLFDEISCGDVGLQGVKVIVPRNRYDLLLARIREFMGERNSTNPVHRFIAFRCDKQFIETFTAGNPEFIGSLEVGSYIYAVSDVDVILRLHELGLLPEQERRRHVLKIRELAVETPDSGFLRDEVLPVFAPGELEDILDYVRSNLLPVLTTRVERLRNSYDRDQDPDDPEEYFDELRSALGDLRKALTSDVKAVSQIEMGLVMIDDAVEELREDAIPEPDYDDYRRGSVDISETESRSIFDDVDT